MLLLSEQVTISIGSGDITSVTAGNLSLTGGGTSEKCYVEVAASGDNGTYGGITRLGTSGL